MLVFLLLIYSAEMTLVGEQGSLYSPVLVHNEKNITEHDILALEEAGYDPKSAACENSGKTRGISICTVKLDVKKSTLNWPSIYREK